MAKLQATIDTETDAGDDLIPEGHYIVQGVRNKDEESKSGGRMATAEYEITFGSLEGRRLFERYNYVHSNGDAQRIARRSLARLFLAVGMPGSHDDLDDAMGIKFVAQVKIQPGKNGYADSNTISKYLALDADSEELARETEKRGQGGGNASAGASRFRDPPPARDDDRPANNAPPPKAAPAKNGSAQRPWN